MGDLGCQFAVERGGVVRCRLLDTIKSNGLTITQVDRTFTDLNIAFMGVAENMTCGWTEPSQRGRCVGAWINSDNISLLLDAIRNGNVLIFPENLVLMGRLVGAGYFE